MRNQVLLAAFVSVAGSLCAATIADADDIQCRANATSSGSFFSGKSFQTWDVVPADPSVAFKKAYLFLAKEGWHFSQADKDLGVISASEEVSYSQGHSAPLTVVVEAAPGQGSKLTATLVLGGGQVARKPIDYLCQLISSAAE